MQSEGDFHHVLSIATEQRDSGTEGNMRAFIDLSWIGFVGQKGRQVRAMTRYQVHYEKCETNYTNN
jgi:hypothetical protein